MTPVEEILVTGWPVWVKTVAYGLIAMSLLFALWAAGRHM